MKIENKWTDFSYVYPEPLSEACTTDLLAIQGSKKDAIDLYKDWHFKYNKEIDRYRQTVLSNVSNFVFMTSFIGTEKWPGAKKILEGYVGKYGFFHQDNKWICNHKKALSFTEKVSFAEATPKPVYGGVYE
jgi:hypothetical protein